MTGAARKAPTNKPILLDFGGLFSDTAVNAPDSPVEPRKENNTLIRPIEEKPATAAIQPATELLKTADIYKKYQENTIKSSELQTAILKGLNAGEDITTLFLQAAKAISLMTNNEVFYSQAEESITAIYGAGLHKEAPLNIELSAVEERLFLLEEAALWNEGGELMRIQRAIEAHQNRVEKLRKLIEEEKPT